MAAAAKATARKKTSRTTKVAKPAARKKAPSKKRAAGRAKAGSKAESTKSSTARATKAAKRKAAKGPAKSTKSAKAAKTTKARSIKAAKPVAKKVAPTRTSRKPKAASGTVKVARPEKAGKTTRAKKAPARKKMTAAVRAARAARRKMLKHFRALLVDKQRSLMQTYQSTSGDSRAPTSDGTEDYIDYAVSSYAREFSLSLTEMERKQLRLVEDALRRVDRGDYGRCQQCGQEIPPKRLEVEPWAKHCIRCQELEEQGLLQEAPFDAGEAPGDEEGAAPRENALGEAGGDDVETEDDDEEESG
jgi:DnaK suppressor protein